MVTAYREPNGDLYETKPRFTDCDWRSQPWHSV